MRQTADPLLGIISALIVVGPGIWVLWQGYVRVKHPEQCRPKIGRLAVYLTQLFSDAEAARRKETTITNLDNIRRSGRWALLAGSLMCMGGMLQLLGWLIKLLQ